MPSGAQVAPCSAGRACAHAHVRDVLPFPHPLNGTDRECPACRGNLSINPADDRRAHVLITCHGSKCTETAAGRRDIRERLLKHGIAEGCLGSYGLGGDGPTASVPRPRRESDPGLLAAARRDAAYASLIDASASLGNATVLRMCMQRIRESTDGNVTGDLAQLIPSDREEFIALARRAGIQRIQASTLATRWLGKRVADA